MPWTCRLELREIVHSGSDLGDDWGYEIVVNGRRVSIDGSGYGRSRDRILVDPPETWILRGQEHPDVLSVPIRVTAEERDLLFDDRGQGERTLELPCPEPGEPPRHFPNQQLVARVQGTPAFLARVNWVAFVFDAELRSVEAR